MSLPGPAITLYPHLSKLDTAGCVESGADQMLGRRDPVPTRGTGTWRPAACGGYGTVSGADPLQCRAAILAHSQGRLQREVAR